MQDFVRNSKKIQEMRTKIKRIEEHYKPYKKYFLLKKMRGLRPNRFELWFLTHPGGAPYRVAPQALPQVSDMRCCGTTCGCTVRRRTHHNLASCILHGHAHTESRCMTRLPPRHRGEERVRCRGLRHLLQFFCIFPPELFCSFWVSHTVQSGRAYRPGQKN